MSYTLYIIDYERHRDQLPPRDSIQDLKAVGEVLKRLDRLEPGPNPRFEQLAGRLLKRFPLKPPEPGRGASEAEVEAYMDAEDPVWRGNNDPVEEVRTLHSAMWMPDIATDKVPDFMAVLIPAARELGLDIYDDQVGIYFSATGAVVPPQYKKVRNAIDPWAAKPARPAEAAPPPQPRLRGVVLMSELEALTAGLGTSYPLHVFDYGRNQYTLPFRMDVKDLAMVSNVMERLERAKPGPSIRFERLARHLLKHFPLDVAAEDGTARPGTSVWRRNADPVAEVQVLKAAVWSPDIVEDKAPEFLEVLLPMARALGLDVYDGRLGLYCAATGTVVPSRREDMRNRLDPAAAQAVRYTKATLRKAFIERLTPALAPHGFVGSTVKFASFFYKREVEGGGQVIMGDVEGDSLDYRCRITLKCFSDRVFAFRQARNPDHPGYEDFPGQSSAFLSEYFFKIREVVEPAWRNEDSYSAEHARTPEEIDWMVEDLLKWGLPILEKARTIEGMNWLCTSEEASKLYPDNLSQCREIKRTIAFYEVMLYARWANNPRFEEIVEFVLDFNRSLGKRGWDQARLEEWADYCRTHVQPVGTGPA